MRARLQKQTWGKLAASVAIVGAGLLGFSGAAHADSAISGVQAAACVEGTTARSVSISYFSNATFTTGVRIHVVSGTPDGPIINTITRDIAGAVSIVITTELPEGTYYFDWEDRSGDGITWSGRHSTLSPTYNGIFLGTKTVVAPCVVPTTTSTTTTVAPLVPVTAASTVPTTAAPTTAPSTTIVAAPPIASAATTSTAAATPTLVATGANSTPWVLSGTVCLLLGTGALVVARRQPRTEG